MHLHRKCSRLGLPLALPNRAFAQIAEVVLANRHIPAAIGRRADVVDHYFKVHLSLAAQPLDIGCEVALVGSDGTAECIVVRKGSTESEWKDGGKLEAVRDYLRMVLSATRVHPRGIFSIMFGYNDCELACWEKEYLITK